MEKNKVGGLKLFNVKTDVGRGPFGACVHADVLIYGSNA